MLVCWYYILPFPMFHISKSRQRNCQYFSIFVQYFLPFPLFVILKFISNNGGKGWWDKEAACQDKSNSEVFPFHPEKKTIEFETDWNKYLDSPGSFSFVPLQPLLDNQV